MDIIHEQNKLKTNNKKKEQIEHARGTKIFKSPKLVRDVFSLAKCAWIIYLKRES